MLEIKTEEASVAMLASMLKDQQQQFENKIKKFESNVNKKL